MIVITYALMKMEVIIVNVMMGFNWTMTTVGARVSNSIFMCFSYNQKVYIDHNECLSNTHVCEQVCHNSHGTYTCTCNTGYRLASNNRTCDGTNGNTDS